MVGPQQTENRNAHTWKSTAAVEPNPTAHTKRIVDMGIAEHVRRPAGLAKRPSAKSVRTKVRSPNIVHGTVLLAGKYDSAQTK